MQSLGTDKELTEGIDLKPHQQIPELTLDTAKGQRGDSHIIVFLTLAMPDIALKQWLIQAQRAGVTTAIRGFYKNNLKDTIRRLQDLPSELQGGVSIDPMAFRRLGITHAPVVVALSSALPPCETRSCESDGAPAHDRVSGNIGLEAALEILENEGRTIIGQGRAREALVRLRQASKAGGGYDE